MNTPRMSRPKLLDLFCGAGGAAMGYHRAGFDPVGVDHIGQPRYPFAFVREDAIGAMNRLLLGGPGATLIDRDGRHWAMEDFRAIHASPPCQRYTSMQFLNPGRRQTHPDLVGPCRELLEATGLPWVMENVPGAPMPGAALVCGSAFGMDVRRHRLFLGSFLILGTVCRHAAQKGQFPRGTGKALHYGRKPYSNVVSVWGGSGGGKGPKSLWQRAMGIDWMTRHELAQAIPPAYTEYVGRQLGTLLDQQPGGAEGGGA